MSIDHLQLDTGVIASLYHKVIVSKHPGQNTGLQVTSHNKISFVGDNAKSITIVVASEDHHTLAEKSWNS